VPLTDGFSHVASVTDDVDRLVGFYKRVFDAPVLFDMEEDGMRHAAIDIGANVVLHAFHVPWAPGGEGREMFARGRTDHYGLTVRSMEALLEIRRRLMVEGSGSTDGAVRDFGPLYSLHYVDPDGVHLEVNLFKDGWGSPSNPVLPRSEWTILDLDQTSSVAS
jgi:catechol 2,3-dioxygenase-like lactoylglutathione lyase family enzyme